MENIMQINIKDLQNRTVQSINAFSAKAEVELEIKRKKEQEEKKKQQKKANRIIARIPGIIEKSISKGEWDAVVMKMSTKEYDPDESSLPFGVARIVWDECKKNGLKVKADYWYGGDGMDSGYNLVISWRHN